MRCLLEAASQWRAEMNSHCLFERGKLAVPFFFSAINSGESSRSGRVNTSRIGGSPHLGELLVDHGHERSWPLT